MENDIKLKNKNVETYTDDMVRAIESDKGGLIKKIIHEEEVHEAIKKNLSPNSKRNRLFMLISFVLIFLTFTIFVSIMFLNNENKTVSVAPQYTSLIFMDQTDFKDVDGLNKDKIADTILNQLSNTKMKAGGVEGVYLTENKKVVGFNRFNTLIKSNLILDPNNLAINDNFLLGAYNGGVKSSTADKGFFILLRTRSFFDVFPVINVWENKMLLDLGRFFGVNITPETNYLFTKNWEDGIVVNKNARILKDKDGKIVLMYIFVDDNSVVITNSESAIKEVSLRLTSSKIKK